MGSQSVGSRPRQAEVIVVGGGHNGLICAAYLARAGIDTLVLEARSEVGGCASTVEDLGARFNICHCDHTMVRALPIVDELALADHGLRYLEPGATNVYLFHDRSDPWVLFNDAERTVDGLAVDYPTQVAGYRRYLADALPMAALTIDLASTLPTGPRLVASTVRGRDRFGTRAAAAARLIDWSRRSASEVLARYFDDWRVVQPAVSLGPTVWGVPPEVPGTGLAALGYAIRHLVKTGRPEGGSGRLTDALRASFESAGGRVRCGSTVAGLLVDDGAVQGVRLADGQRVLAPVVVTATDPGRVLVDWLDDPPPAAKRLARRYRDRPPADGYESKIDAVVTEPPRFRGLDRLEARFGDVDLLAPSAIVSPDPVQLAEAHSRRADGLVAEHPTMLVNAPSVLDPTMRPDPDHHVLSLEVLFTPYGLPGGWSASTEPERWLDCWSALAEPGFRRTIERWRVMTPDRYEREFSLKRGFAPAYSASPLATLLGTNRELSRYRTPIGGLYLTGAGTYPGAGIFGAAGRNAAGMVIGDLRGPVRRRVSALGRRSVEARSRLAASR